jgi:hypothetical protein
MSDSNLRLAPSREEMMVNIVSRLQIDGGNLPASEDEFWRQVAIRLDVQPQGSTISTVQRIFEQLGQPWSEEYLEDDQSNTAISAFEALYSVLPSSSVSYGSDSVDPTVEAEEEDDDDSIDALGDGFNPQAPPVTTNIATVMHSLKQEKLVLNPEWQRSFVWKPQKMQRLIESILLGLPIPSFLLYRDNKTGKTYVIDGRQRLETISRFMAPKPAKGEQRLRFKTFPATTEGWRPGQSLHRAAGAYYDDLPEELRAKFDSAPLVTCTFTDLRPGILYQIFKRYNTGAVALNPAEIRNAVYQSTGLHAMMYRVAGEHRDPLKYEDADEKEVGEALRLTMQGKFERYGGYDFVGRYFAFGHMKGGTVANATNQFMEQHASAPQATVESLRQEFIRVFRKSVEWYDPPFTKPGDGKFHAFFATVQMVSTKHMLALIDAGIVEEQAVVNAIDQEWSDFALKKADEKQNSGLFWGTQKEWIDLLEVTSKPSSGATST